MHFCESKILEIRTENRTNQLNTTIKSTEQIADLHKLLKLYQHSRPQLKKFQEWNETTSSWGNVLGSELCLKLRFPFWWLVVLIQNQQYFLITLETTKTEFGRNPVNLSKKCCHTKETLPRSVPDATFPALHTKPSRGMIGLLLVRWVHVVGAGWPVLTGTGRDQGFSCW